MKPLVFSARDNDEVVGRIVERVAIGVMDDLGEGELPTFALLDDMPVFGDLDAIHADVAIATLHPTLAADRTPVVTSPVAAWDAGR